jgi:hypothetical protein
MGPPGTWRLPALLKGLVQTVLEAPPTDPAERDSRRELGLTLIALLEGRGLDFDRFQRFALSPWVAGGLVASAAAVGLAERESEPTMPADWFRVWEGLPSPEDEAEEPRIMQFLAIVLAWLRSASREDLLLWRAPEPGATDTTPPASSSRRVEEQWVMDRFLETYLSNWSTDSLHEEWRYVHGQRRNPCSPAEMSSRHVDESDLAKTIADRSVQASQRSTSSRISVKAFVPVALRFLREGRRAEAAAVFEAATEADPANGESHNNRGFCLLPDDPAGAVVEFDTAERLGYPEVYVARTNKALGLALLGRLTSSLALLDAIATDIPPGTGAFMWSVEGTLGQDQPEVREVELLHYLTDVGVAVAKLSGEAAPIAMWEAKARALTTERGES